MLYVVAPASKKILVSVPLSGCEGEIIDVAVNRTGIVYATTFNGLYRIDPSDGTCTLIRNDFFPNSLGFVPEGNAGAELLVGYRDSSYCHIDPTTGGIQLVGGLSAGYTSSGDIVTTKDGRTYLTIKGDGCNDCLVKIDPGTGALSKLVGPMGQSDVYGLAYAGDSLYGFTRAGLMLTIDPSSATSKVLPLVNAIPGLSFSGAAASRVGAD
ncbi:hypothetical protein [Polyangium sp. 15x6]|uniref:hypothetical protein n=1 Tax=Polyangium sp. 15x6 TaxID=3042687 RepID=UPI002499BA57|nr:hypothetical protein [Polyangium sp. 15x6]MDI3291957.1 hypothetical protein [Polyangium sp. 15x6]